MSVCGFEFVPMNTICLQRPEGGAGVPGAEITCAVNQTLVLGKSIKLS